MTIIVLPCEDTCTHYVVLTILTYKTSHHIRLETTKTRTAIDHKKYETLHSMHARRSNIKHSTTRKS